RSYWTVALLQLATSVRPPSVAAGGGPGAGVAEGCTRPAGGGRAPRPRAGAQALETSTAPPGGGAAGGPAQVLLSGPPSPSRPPRTSRKSGIPGRDELREPRGCASRSMPRRSACGAVTTGPTATDPRVET